MTRDVEVQKNEEGEESVKNADYCGTHHLEKGVSGEPATEKARVFLNTFHRLNLSRIDFERSFEAERELCISSLRWDYLPDMKPQERLALLFLFENL